MGLVIDLCRLVSEVGSEPGRTDSRVKRWRGVLRGGPASLSNIVFCHQPRRVSDACARASDARRRERREERRVKM